MQKYVCGVCGYEYDPAENDNVPFEDLPDDWTCPVCGVEVSGDASPCDCGTVWNVYPIYEGDSVRTVARKVETDMVPMKVASVKQDAITLL